MKPSYYFIFALLFFFSNHSLIAQRIPLPENANDANVGYIVTLDNKKLTGKIGDIFYSDLFSAVIFINDFGTPYQLRAELISGFVFKNNVSLVEYVSLYEPKSKNWSFLKVLEKGAYVSLFKAPNERSRKNIREDNSTVKALSGDKYWIKFKERRPFKVNWLNYKSQLKQYLFAYPNIRKKIGREGYKFKDLDKIIEEVNTVYTARKRTI